MATAQCKCGHIACVCGVKETHAAGCKYRAAVTCPVGVECDHGYDVCPTCDPCTCPPTPASTCSVCGHTLDAAGDCDICVMAHRENVTIEEVRLYVEENARFWSARLGEACTCGAGSGCVPIQEGPRRGRGARPMGVIHFEVTHADGCPRSPGRFDWTPIDEAERRRVFGYDGRTRHAERLAALLRFELREREVLEA